MVRLARRALRLLLEADVEPDRRVEGRELVDEDRLQLRLERLGLVVVGEVAALAAPAADRVDDPADHLLHGALALRRRQAAAEVLLGDDVGRRLRPELRELDVALLERRAVLARDQRVARLPFDLVERIATGDGEDPARCDARVGIDDDVLDLLCSPASIVVVASFAVAILSSRALDISSYALSIAKASCERTEDGGTTIGRIERGRSSADFTGRLGGSRERARRWAAARRGGPERGVPRSRLRRRAAAARRVRRARSAGSAPTRGRRCSGFSPPALVSRPIGPR